MRPTPKDRKKELLEVILEQNRGCYGNPFSGVGMEFDPLEVAGTGRHVVLHECGYLPMLERWMFPNTVSPFWRLYYNAVPGHHVVFGGKEIPLGPERIVLIPGGNAFDGKGTVLVEHFWMTFSLRVTAAGPGPIFIPVEERRAKELRRISGGFTEMGKGDRFVVYHRSMALLHGILVEIRNKLWTGNKSDSLARAVEYMHANVRKPLTGEMVAEHAGINRRTLSDHFAREYHCSPMRFLSRLRVGEAASLLARTDLGLDQVAEAAGFTDRYYLSRVFKKETGRSPAAYRREMTRSM